MPKSLSHYKSQNSKSICTERWILECCILFAYRPRNNNDNNNNNSNNNNNNNNNKREVFNEISNTLSKALKSYDNVVLAGDLYVDWVDPSKALQIICPTY